MAFGKELNWARGMERRDRLTLQKLARRWFGVRNAPATSPPVLLKPWHGMSFLGVPMTRVEVRRDRGVRDRAA
jgi:hypothetical protein